LRDGRRRVHSVHFYILCNRRYLHAMTEKAPPDGLRVRKARETRQRLAEVALRMFLANGYEATTLDMIAEAAKVSRRTFFHHFDSKDAILSTWVIELDEVARSAVADQPEGTTPLEAVHAALVKLASRYESGEALAIDRLMRSTDTLRARKQANYESQERSLASALVERWPEPERQWPLRLVAMAGIGALRVAIEKWAGEMPRGQLVDYVNEAFAQLKSEFTNAAPHGRGLDSRRRARGVHAKSR
jgi:AcrR family transcriptional regulator